MSRICLPSSLLERAFRSSRLWLFLYISALRIGNGCRRSSSKLHWVLPTRRKEYSTLSLIPRITGCQSPNASERTIFAYCDISAVYPTLEIKQACRFLRGDFWRHIWRRRKGVGPVDIGVSQSINLDSFRFPRTRLFVKSSCMFMVLKAKTRVR